MVFACGYTTTAAHGLLLQTLAELYAPDAMPTDLLRAHERNDEVVERIYIGRLFKNDTERLEKLFELYSRMSGQAGAGQRRVKRA